jgi:5-methylcytosine-specific restriction endonuclease McrA
MHNPCHYCGQRIDYALGNTHPDSFTVDHVKPLSLYPELAEDRSNLVAAHMRCNSAKGNGNPKPSIGVNSAQW